jgi:lipoate-protein ligase A
MSLFDKLIVHHDVESRSAAMHMAIDEALLRSTCTPAIRFYRWSRPSLSFGYFGNFSEVAPHQAKREIVRRWTGGGIVFHGDDLTYSIVIPHDDAAFAESSMSIYEETHRAIQNALGHHASLATSASPKISDSCFANPVRADVMVNGNKIAGAAQRKTRSGLLQQGSIQHVDLANDFEERFARALCIKPMQQELEGPILDQAQELASQKYGTAAWLERR